MPKYQIILSSNEIFSDQEFIEVLKESNFAIDSDPFILIEARNLEGIREELWKTKEELIEHSNLVNDSNDSEKAIEESFNEISKLFKLDS